MNNVIDLSSVARPARSASDQQSSAKVATFVAPALTPRQHRRHGKPQLQPPATETARAFRLRNGRRDAWWRAERLVEYRRARLEWEDALKSAQRNGIADSASFPPVQSDRMTLITIWREAVAQQILTPAPDLRAVEWKRAQLRKRDGYLPIEAARIEQAIAEDVAFLAAHPVRRTDEQAVIRRREFKASVRQRIQEVAACRGLSDADIKSVLSLRHHRIGIFAKAHGVNLAWLLEGGGPMFMADSKRIRAIVHEVMAEREAPDDPS